MQKITLYDLEKQLGENHFVSQTLFVKEGRYQNGSTAVCLLESDTIDAPVYCKLSVNIPGESEKLPPDTFFVKNWSENERIVAAMVEQGIIEEVWGTMATSGFVAEISAYRFVKITLDADVIKAFAPSRDLL